LTPKNDYRIDSNALRAVAHRFVFHRIWGGRDVRFGAHHGPFALARIAARMGRSQITVESGRSVLIAACFPWSNAFFDKPLILLRPL
jgi:hypothetical protein